MLIKKKESIRIENSSVCIAYGYEFKDKDINVAPIEIRGRYPESGYVINELVKEMFFVSFGNGKVVIENETFEINQGDMIFILPKKKYLIEGNIDLIVSCSPAWSPEQHKHIDE
jgi:mannose-6-phosphate isomerase-like protein (cupin superfamily)